MTSLKLSTVWVTVSKIFSWGTSNAPGLATAIESRPTSLRTASPQFRALYRRLLLSYLGAMIGVVGISTLVVYRVVVYILHQQLDQQLVRLADAAAHHLQTMQAEQVPFAEQSPRTLDNDGDLDIPWQDLRETEQSIEWFDRNQQLLGQAGKIVPDTSPAIGFQVLPSDNLRSLTIPVYFSPSSTPQTPKFSETLVGYVRVSESSAALEEELARLRLGLGIGGGIAITLIGGTGWWLTRRSIQPIEQSVVRLQQFTADASHELRSPLTAIRTSIDVMQSHPERVHAADRQKLEAISSAAAQMTHLVEDLLLLARADATLPDANDQMIPLDDLLEDLITVLELQAQAKGIQLHGGSIDPQMQVQGDPAQLRRLFTNLIENAIQYTPQGGDVWIRAYSLGKLVFVAVQDAGIGIAPDQMPYIFDRFWRADQARSRRDGGTGLGLAIAQTIAQAHGGEITAISQVNVGSCLQVRLPLFYRNNDENNDGNKAV